MVGSKDLPPSERPFYPNVFFRNQFRAKPHWPSKDADLSGSTAIVTGSNVGLGLEASLQLLALKLSRLVVAVRSLDKGEEAAAEMRSWFPKADIRVWSLDMSSYPSIQAFAKRADSELDRIDMVILNAGVGRFSYNKNKTTGHEECLQTNYLSTVFLAVLLLPVLKRKKLADRPAPRLTITGAALALQAELKQRGSNPLFPALDSPDNFDGYANYTDSKLLAHMFLWKLADYVSASDVVVTIADPAWVRGTRFGRDLESSRVIAAVMGVIMLLVARSTRVGASCLVDAVVNHGPEAHGCFLMSWEIHPFASMLYTPEGQELTERVWDETMAEFEFADIRGIVESIRK